MTNDNNLSVSLIEERKSLQLPRREASGVSPRRLHENQNVVRKGAFEEKQSVFVNGVLKQGLESSKDIC